MNTNTGNIYKTLKSLISDDFNGVGTSQGPNGDGTTDVLLIGGGTVTVTGDGYVLNTQVYVSNGFITGEAPSLTPTTIDV